jgi:hypothetical protein
MYQNRFTRILSVMIAVQMAVPPFALAQSRSESHRRMERPVAPVADTRGDFDTPAAIMQGMSTIFSNITNSMQQQAATIAAQNQANSLKQEMNPQNCGTISQPVACVSEIFPQCQILNTFPNLVEPSECTDGVDGSSPNAGIQAGVAAGYYAHFALMENEYKLKGLESNNTSNVGLGCLNAKADELQRNLKKREDEIDNLINKMQKEQDNFKAQAERERNTIDEAMALLEGGNYKSDRSKAVLDQNTVRFDDVFKNNNACSAVLNNDDFRGEGTKAGFKGIEARLSSIANKKETGGSSFSAMEFNQNTAERIEADVKRMSSLAAREIQSKGDSVLADGFKGLPSAYGLSSSPAFTAALLEQTKSAELDKADILRKTQGVVDSRSQSLVSELQNDTVDYEFILNRWERSEKNTCLTRNSNIAGLISQDLGIIDPNGSKEANKFSDNAYRTFIKDTLGRGDISIEKKMELIAAEERRNGNGRFIVDTQASATSGDSTIKASEKNSPANFINRIVENCKQQFEQNTNDKGVTRREVITQMRKVRSEMMNYRRTLAGNVQKALVNRIMNCQDSGTANAAGIATCSSRDLSTASPSFCVKRANACATNMRQCLTAAEKEVKKVTTVRDASVAQYKANMARHEDNLKKMYLLTENITSLDGLNIAASLKQGLVLPTNLKFHIDQKDRTFAKGLESMEVQDPDQYFNLMKANLVELKKAVKTQNDQVMRGAPGAPAGAQQGVMGHIANIRKNMQDVVGSLQEYKSKCQQAYQAYNRGVQQANQEAAQAANERQTELREYCLNASAYANPSCDNADDFDQIIDAAQQVGDSEGIRRFSGFRSTCRRFGSNSETGTINPARFSNLINEGQGRDPSLPKLTINTYCAQDGIKDEGACLNYNNYISVCSGEPDQAVVKRLHTEGLIPRTIDVAACDPPATPSTTTGPGSAVCTTARNSIASSPFCRDSLADVRKEAMNTIAEELQESSGTDLTETANTGENRSSVCAAFDNSGANAITKALQDVGSQFGTNLVNGAVQPR